METTKGEQAPINSGERDGDAKQIVKGYRAGDDPFSANNAPAALTRKSESAASKKEVELSNG
jgi:hypothetical protein